MATLVGQSLGRYDITEHIGEGGMGVVYRAHDTRLDRDVAIKVIKEVAVRDGSRIERFKREARAVAKLSHPNILEIHDFGSDDEVIFAVMELLEGISLRQRLAQGRLPVREAMRIAKQAADGLEAAHNQGIVHRDIKPENLFLTRDGRLKILDFGVAHLRSPIAPESSKTETTVSLTDAGTILGTPRYMSPEQVRGQRIDCTSDLFSLGCVTYEMITGKHPFLRTTKADTISAILHEDPAPMGGLRPNVSPSLNDLVLRCLEKRPRDRFHSAHDLGCSFQALGETGSWSGRVIRRRLLITSQRLGAAAVGAVAVVVVLFGIRHTRTFFVPPTELPDLLHLGVVPFSVAAESETLQPMADGIAAAIARDIARLEPFADGRLWVVEPERIFAGNLRSCEAIRKMFNTSVCLEGSFEQRSDVISLTLEVKDAATGAVIAGETIENPASNIALMQTEPAMVTAQLLSVGTPGEREGLLGKVPTNVTPAFVSALRGIGFLASDTGPDGTMMGVSSLEDAVSSDPLFVNAWVALGEGCRRRFHQTGQRSWLERGFEALDNALKLQPSASAYRVLSALHSSNEDRGAAVAALQNAVQLEPAGAESFQRLGKALRGDRRFSDAVKALQRAINLRPGYWIYHHDLASLYYSRGEYDSAANQWRRVTECAPLYDGGFANLGVANFQLDNMSLTKTNLERAIELNPDTNANTYLTLGSLYFSDAQYADAAEMFEKALELNDSSYFTWGNLGFSLAYGLQPERAEQAFRRAVKLAEDALERAPDDAELLSDLAGYHAGLDNKSKSRDCLTKAIGLDPSDPRILATIGETYEDLGDRERALEWVENAFAAGALPARFDNRPTLRSLISDPRYQALKAGTNQRAGPDSTL